MTQVNNFVENGGRSCRTRARSVSVDVDPNVQKKIFEKNLKFFREVTPGSPSPRKPHINTGIPSNTDPLGQQASIGGFGVQNQRRPVTKFQHTGSRSPGTRGAWWHLKLPEDLNC